MTFTFCPNCGNKLVKREIGDEGLMNYCLACERPVFDRFSTCIITLVLNEAGEAALLRQNYVSTEHHCLVAGHIKPGESAEETVFRETKEELGLEVLGTRYRGSYFYAKKDMLMLSFLTNVRSGEFHLSGEVDEAIWVPAEKAPELLRDGSIAKQVVLDYLTELC